MAVAFDAVFVLSRARLEDVVGARGGGSGRKFLGSGGGIRHYLLAKVGGEGSALCGESVA